MRTGYIDHETNQLIMADSMNDPDELVVASVNRSFDNKYRWFSSITFRSGRSFFETPEKALLAAAKTLGIQLL